MLEVGKKAPDFELEGSDGKKHKLSDYKGKYVVLYFYPKDNTPGCSIEAQSFRDTYNDYNDIDAVVLGVSRDSLKSHDKFIEKFNLPFVLLSDEKEEVVKEYDVLKEKTMFGKKVMGIVRTTFIINPEGEIIKIYSKPKTENHGNLVLEELKELMK